MSKERLPNDAMARRALLRTVGGTIAGAVVAGRAAISGQDAGRSPVHGHVTSTPDAATQEAAAAALRALPRALDDHERSTLAVLGEQLVPGSTKAGVPDLLDRLMAVEAPDGQRRFRSALGAFEREARTRHAKAWLELTEAEQVAILDQVSTMPSSVGRPVPWKPGQSGSPAGAAGPPPPATLRDHHDHLRGVVARVYFATEPGMTELGWTGLEFWDALPACRPE